MVAALVQSTAGIGFGLIAAPLLVLVDPAFVPATVIFLGTLVSLMSAIRDFSAVNRRFVVAGVAGRLPAAMVAASLVATLPQAAFQVLFAVSIILAVLMSVWGPALWPSARVMFGAGLVSGFMGTLTAVGAPPFALALQRVPAAELRATMNAVLLLGACISMASLAVFGAFGAADMARGAAMLPAVFLGFFLARFVIRDRRTERVLRPAVLAICTAASVVLLVRALSAVA